MEIRQPKRKFTVLFFVDGNRGVETFAEHVTCTYSDAFDKAVAKVKRNASHMCASYELANATEITTYAGHLENAHA